MIDIAKTISDIKGFMNDKENWTQRTLFRDKEDNTSLPLSHFLRQFEAWKNRVSACLLGAIILQSAKNDRETTQNLLQYGGNVHDPEVFDLIMPVLVPMANACSHELDNCTDNALRQLFSKVYFRSLSYARLGKRFTNDLQRHSVITCETFNDIMGYDYVRKACSNAVVQIQQMEGKDGLTCKKNR